jgi:hypothetical protein
LTAPSGPAALDLNVDHLIQKFEIKSCPCVQRRLGDVLGPPDRTPRQMHLDRRLLDPTPRPR